MTHKSDFVCMCNNSKIQGNQQAQGAMKNIKKCVVCVWVRTCFPLFSSRLHIPSLNYVGNNCVSWDYLYEHIGFTLSQTMGKVFFSRHVFPSYPFSSTGMVHWYIFFKANFSLNKMEENCPLKCIKWCKSNSQQFISIFFLVYFSFHCNVTTISFLLISLLCKFS